MVYIFCSEDTPQPSKTLSNRCEECRQHLDSSDLVLFPGHPEGALEEFVLLTDPKLSLFSGDEESINEYDERPQQKITGFK